MKKFVMATNNSHKIVEISRVMEELNINVVSPKDINISLRDVDENGKTFAENAYIKAKACYDLTGFPSIADDSGICVDALDGKPGIYSARFAGENATDKDRNNLLLSMLKDTPKDKRGAHYTCAICCIIDSNTVIEVEGKCFGKIAFEESGNHGFGYDPIFITDEYNITFGDLSDEQKDKISHRGLALLKLKDEIMKIKEEI